MGIFVFMCVRVCVSACCSVLAVEDGCGEEATHNVPTKSSTNSVAKKKAAIQYAGLLKTKGFKHF